MREADNHNNRYKRLNTRQRWTESGAQQVQGNGWSIVRHAIIEMDVQQRDEVSCRKGFEGHSMPRCIFNQASWQFRGVITGGPGARNVRCKLANIYRLADYLASLGN